MDGDLSSVQTQLQEVNSNATVMLNAPIISLYSLSNDGSKQELVTDKFDATTPSNFTTTGENVFAVEQTKG